jgi:hypothetical protein
MQASGCFPDARVRSCSRGEELIPLRLCAFVNGFAGHAMKRRLGRALLAVALTSLVAYPLQAATLDAIRGHVIFNRGAGYEFARSSVEVAPGDMIIANAGGNAQLVYADGCSAPARIMPEHLVLRPARSSLVLWRSAAVSVPPFCSARVVISLQALRECWHA